MHRTEVFPHPAEESASAADELSAQAATLNQLVDRLSALVGGVAA